MRTIRIAFFLFIFAQVSCAEGVKNIEGASSWFYSNKKNLMAINELLLLNPVLKRIDTELSLKFLPKYGEFSNADQVLYNEVIKKCQSLGIKNITIARRGNSSDGDLIAISYTLFSEGFVSDGYAVSVEFIPDSSFLEKAKKQGLYYQSLNIDNWYVVEYRG